MGSLNFLANHIYIKEQPFRGNTLEIKYLKAVFTLLCNRTSLKLI